MKIAFGLGHPAHFYLYKNVIQLLSHKHEIEIFINDKDILRKLLDFNAYPYITIATSKSDENIFGKASKLYLSAKALYKITKNHKPDVFVSCLSQLCWVSRLQGKKNIFNAEDDITYTYLQGLITYPFVSTILTSQVVKTWPFTYKQIGYAGYHKLAYLHPKWFTPVESIRNLYIKEPHYFIIRTVNHKAYHDINARGLDIYTLRIIINYLKDYGAVYISSEKPLPKEFQGNALSINENDIHHVLYYADLFIGDSQSMTVESAMLGTPSIRINNFTNRISVIKELEYTYRLTYSISPKMKDKIIPIIKEIFSINREEFRNRRNLMLNEKIDVTSFLAWFIENYPTSRKIMKENPDYQYNFR